MSKKATTTPRTPEEAKALGLKRYSNGIPCPHGHIAERFVSSRTCCVCARELVRRRQHETEYEQRRKERNGGSVHAKNGSLPQPTRPEPWHCELCGRGPAGRFKTLALDHCYTTSEFRGWLCGHCNTILGKIGDTHEALTDWFEKAKRYLQRER